MMGTDETNAARLADDDGEHIIDDRDASTLQLNGLDSTQEALARRNGGRVRKQIVDSFKRRPLQRAPKQIQNPPVSKLKAILQRRINQRRINASLKNRKMFHPSPVLTMLAKKFHLLARSNKMWWLLAVEERQLV